MHFFSPHVDSNTLLFSCDNTGGLGTHLVMVRSSIGRLTPQGATRQHNVAAAPIEVWMMDPLHTVDAHVCCITANWIEVADASLMSEEDIWAPRRRGCVKLNKKCRRTETTG